jgi:vacuolar protein sorting-associated protein 13A/C
MPGIIRLLETRKFFLRFGGKRGLLISWKSGTFFLSSLMCVSFHCIILRAEINFLQDQRRTRVVSLDVRANGQKQVLRITNYSAEKSLYKPRQRGSSVSVTRQDTASSAADAFEAITEEVTPILGITIDLAGIGVSLINKRLVEVVYLIVDAIKFEYTNNAVAQSANLSCGTLQIDNQLYEALFPVILQPTPIAKESTSVGALPTVQASILWLKDQGT